jgi:nitric oxide reductase activation protein
MRQGLFRTGPKLILLTVGNESEAETRIAILMPRSTTARAGHDIRQLSSRLATRSKR